MGTIQTTANRTRADRAISVPAPRPPRLYALHPLLIGELPAWPEHFARAAALGFDAVSVPPMFQPVADGDLFRVADYDRPHPALAAAGDGDTTLRSLAGSAREAGLDLFLDIDLSRAPDAGGLAVALPAAFAPAPPLGARDPRVTPAARGMRVARWDDPPSAATLLAWWDARLRRWTDSGVAGFRCLDATAVPAPIWAALTARRLVGWAPAAPRGAVAALGGAGFAGFCDSLAEWDFRAGWYAEQRMLLARVATSLATVEAPFGPRFAARHPPGLVALAARRQLQAAGFSGGLLVPMGFEFGARRASDAARDTPDDWVRLCTDAPVDLTAELVALNAALERSAAPTAGVAATGPDAPMVGLLDPSSGRLLVANPDLEAPADCDTAGIFAAGGGRFRRFDGASLNVTPGARLHLAPGVAAVLQGVASDPIHGTAPPVDQAAAAPRVAIEAVAPAVDAGRFAVKRVVGEVVDVACDLICDGHDRLAGGLRWRGADAADWHEVPLRALGNDRWGAAFPLERVGAHVFVVEAWVDPLATWRHGIDAKLAAGQDVTLELEEGRRLLEGVDPALAKRLVKAASTERLDALRDDATTALMQAADPRPHRATSAEFVVDADRPAARFASWYELFPRSQSGDPARHGNFDDVIRQLPRVRAMGFDVLYFPPIHPIGRAFRKGRNNTLTPGADDPGSPYAIGGEAGGHDAIHPELGTLDDFRRLRDAAAAEGLELALDFAVQCSPDHPWLREHRDWFAWRPDGTIRYAENPPKKYQDIVNVDFHAPDAIPALWLALRDVVRFWAEEGVRLFRVDNPHTKPLPFWEWLIADIRATDPGVVFLAEAFTRPKLMYRLAKLGFGQSYTYFTWRNEKREIMDYLTELTTTAPRDFFRPHFFVNTPDINPVFLQGGGRPAHLIRAALACTLSGLWGMYQGFEHCDATPLPGREEYRDSEKYQIRVWPDRSPGDIVDEITRLNAIRRANPALHDHLGVAFHVADNDAVLWFRKRSADGANVLLVAVSLDPFGAQEANVELPLWEWGLPDDAALEAHELMRDERVTWRGKTQRVRLEPTMPFAIWRVRPEGGFRPHLPPVAAAPAPTGHG